MTDDKLKTKSLYDQVAAIPGGERLQSCLQCGTCGGSCPSGEAMDHTPREIFAMILAGDQKRDEVLKSNTFWYCLACYYCTVRCPQQIPITELMYRLKRIAVAEGHRTLTTAFSETFVEMVHWFGRGFEMGLAAKFYLLNQPLAMVGMTPMALGMFKRNRMAILPTRVKDMDGLHAILNKAKEIARERDRETGIVQG